MKFGTDRRLLLFGLFAALLVTWLVWATYARIITFGFTGFDTLAHIRQVSSANPNATYQIWLGPLQRGVHYYRPLTMALFALNLQFGGLDATSFQLTHLTIHWANALCVLLLGIVLSQKIWAGLVAGILFALHPALATNVANLANRFDVLMTLGVCLTVLFTLRAYSAKGNTRKLAFGLAWASFVLALGAKEPGIIALPLVFLASILYGEPNSAQPPLRRRLYVALKHNAPFAIITLVWLVLHWYATRNDLHPLQYFRNINLTLLLDYLRYLSVLEQLPASWMAGAALLVGAACTILLIGAWQQRRERRALVFGLVWLMLPIALYIAAGKAVLQVRFAYPVIVPFVLVVSLLLTTVPRPAHPFRFAILGAQAVLAALIIFWLYNAPLIRFPREILDETQTVRSYLEQFDQTVQVLPAGTQLEFHAVPERLAYRNNLRFWLELQWAEKHFVFTRPLSSVNASGPVFLRQEAGVDPARVILRAEYSK